MLNFDGIMKDALEVGLLTTSELDRLTDEVASGAKTEAALAEEWGTKALHFAAKGSGPKGGSSCAIKSLLTHGVNINAPDADGKAPLHTAAWHNQAEVAQLLIDLGAKLEAKDQDGMTPLAGRCNRGSEEARGQWGLPRRRLSILQRKEYVHPHGQVGEQI